MKDMELMEPLAETRLRRALAFDADERPPRFDVAAIVAAAEREPTVAPGTRAARAAALIGLSFAVEVAIGVLAINALGAAGTGTAVLSTGIAAVETAVASLIELSAPLTSPSIALATLAAVLFATVYERGYGRGMHHVRAS